VTAMTDPAVVIVDADTVAGWRRVTPSFDQLRAAVADLRAQAPSSTVAIVGDPALKWALSDADQRLLDEEINHQRIVLAPAGTRGGHTAFIAAAVRRATTDGTSVVVVTDRAIPDCPIARLRRVGTRFAFDLANAAETTAVPTRPNHQRRRRAAG
jgi:hypothetical protein